MTPEFMVDMARLWQRQVWREVARDARVRRARASVSRGGVRPGQARFVWDLHGADCRSILSWCRSVDVISVARFRA